MREMLALPKVAVFFAIIHTSSYLKSSLAKAAAAEVAIQQTGVKWHAAVARSTFLNQNAQNTSLSEPFLKFH